MGKSAIHYTDHFGLVVRRMTGDGLLLVTQGRDAKPNVMTIGWGTVGVAWGRPVFTVLVRPSRYTWTRLEEAGDFTVNVPGDDLSDAVAHCGSVSGRDHDKLEEMSLTAIPSKEVRAPIIKECVVHYECRTVHRNDVLTDALAQAIRDNSYTRGDFHRIYWGEIVAAYADEDAVRRLGE
jgi:flavin reductase (DIM6/NTAB) family NADH-FMN oxidoreductase RutF